MLACFTVDRELTTGSGETGGQDRAGGGCLSTASGEYLEKKLRSVTCVSNGYHFGMFFAFHSGAPPAVTDVVMWNLYVFICSMYVYSKSYINPYSAYSHYHLFVL